MLPARFAHVTSLAALLLSLPGAHVASARPDPAAQREDLAAFRKNFLAFDHAYSQGARAEAERRLGMMEGKAGEIGETRFVVMLAQIVALADNGHTMLVGTGGGAGFARVGIRLAPFGTDFYVVRATSGHADLLGGRLVAVDGHPLAQLRDSVHTLVGGIAAWRDRLAPQYLESPGVLQALGLANAAAQANYRFTMPDGSVRNVMLATGTAAAGPPSHGGSVSALDPAAGTGGWRTLLAPEKAPWALRDFGETMRRRDAPEMDAMVIQLRANVDGARPIAAFLEEADSARKAAGRKNVVLDMRMNGGGNLQLTRDFVTSLPGRLPPDGRIVVLTSPWTFSAAISTTAYLKQAGGNRVVLVGEAPGDRLMFFAEGQPTSLPRSGAMILMATQRHDYLTGCKGFTDCHGPVVRFPISVKSLAPDVAAPWTLDSYVAGRDPGMEAAAKLLKGM